MPKALITGITGQDGRYLAEFLKARGYDVFGLVHEQQSKIEEMMRAYPYVEAVGGDLRELPSLVAAIERAQPDEVYNLGAISPVALSFKQPELVADVTGLGALRMLEAIRIVGGTQDNPIRFYQASSGEMFGRVEGAANEATPLYPRSPYAAAKVFGHHTTVNHREAYGMFACSGILFNHESPRRGEEFVTRKISKTVARIKLGLSEELALGNLQARRDWGFAGDYVRAMWLMLQQPEPDDYVVATGVNHSVREFAEFAFRAAGVDDWERYVRIEPRLFRPADVESLVGDASKAERMLGWQPEVGFTELVQMMVDADLKSEQDRF